MSPKSYTPAHTHVLDDYAKNRELAVGRMGATWAPDNGMVGVSKGAQHTQDGEVGGKITAECWASLLP